MAMANLGDKDEAVIKKAQGYSNWLTKQHVDGSIFNGGIGYGSKGPGHEDLNNTTYAISCAARNRHCC